MFTTLCSMNDNIIFSLCDLRGLCGGKITFLQWSHTWFHNATYRRVSGYKPSRVVLTHSAAGLELTPAPRVPTILTIRSLF